MAFDVDAHLHGESAHPAAKALLTEGSEILWEETGPLGSDAGSTAFAEFNEWRTENPESDLSACFEWIQTGWDTKYSPELLDEDVLRAQLAQEEEGELDFPQEVYVRDESIIATALAQLVHEGRIDASGRETVRFALNRQLNELVLERMFPKEHRPERLRCLSEVARLLDGAKDSREWTEPKASRRPAKGKRRPLPCPWEAGEVMSHRLPSGQLVLLHLFATAGTAPAFYLLDWRGDAVPPADAVRQLEIKPSKNQWKFILVLPDVAADADLAAERAELERVLEPIGVRMESRREPLGTMVFWDSLDDYLLGAYDFEPPAPS